LHLKKVCAIIHSVILKISLTYVNGGVKMAICSVCGKGVSFGHNVSHSNRKTNRVWKPNIRKVKAVVDGTNKTVNVCSRCLRSGKVTRAI
jgi:large subunit ribosomal protein L28